jgi:hypothetical protein
MGPEDNPRDDEPVDREAYEAWERERGNSMTACTHAQLIREEGPIHANDKPPMYRCQLCNEFVRVTLAPDSIGVSYGEPPADASECELCKIAKEGGSSCPIHIKPPAALDVTVAGGEWPEDLWKNLQRILEECNRADLTNAELAKHLRDGVWQYVAALPTRSEAQPMSESELFRAAQLWLSENVRPMFNSDQVKSLSALLGKMQTGRSEAQIRAQAFEEAAKLCDDHAEELTAMIGKDLEFSYGEQDKRERDVRVKDQAYTARICAQRIRKLAGDQ